MSSDPIECQPCDSGTYKEALDDTACLVCPSAHMQTLRGATSAENCTCDEDAGYTWQQASANNLTRVPMPTSASGRCLKVRGNITAAKEVASAFSTVLATGVAASVAASVVAGATIGGGVSGFASIAGGSAGAITGAPLSSAGSALGDINEKTRICPPEVPGF